MVRANDRQNSGGNRRSKDKSQPGGPFNVFVWKIEPRKDYAIVEISGYVESSDGSRKLIEHMETTHQKIDGRWWPKKCHAEFTKGGSETLTFSAAEFDRKNHPSSLDVEIMGIPPGLNAVDRRNFSPDSGPLKMGRYIGGGSIVSVTEWHQTYEKQFDAGELASFIANANSLGKGKYPRWWSAGPESFALENVEYSPDLWEAYVRRWILRHSFQAIEAGNVSGSSELTTGQVEAAWSILSDCRKQAKPLLLRMQEKASVATSQNAEQASSAGRSDTVNLTPKPVEPDKTELGRIFSSLRKRLDGLLTTKQSRANKIHATSQPCLP
ncbi:MAG: hypothetical protein IPK83_16780 [Planctomycetes bacterium]|nr:hypothetical protein [Planctomycetota bacterium]